MRRKGKTKYNYDAVLEYIKCYRDKNGVSPSLREIQEHEGIASLSNVSYIIKELSSQGLLRYTAGISRSYWPREPNGNGKEKETIPC